ncbi:VWA domain-containing protein [Porifericola rhodea]|uniref:VWA domain-containing protein n=1 Tax=Porifericola rhodea TaxID=930972 RepID=UPI00266527BE|nr:VWA domain-containing protein [Porifericola rhodea]WKN32572.1 VWA domain-containing protein [Porifericola rhodea]
MQQVQLLFENSPWLTIPCLLVGAIYAALLYIKSQGFRHQSWGKQINYLLTGLRFLLVSLLCLLLIGPFIKQIKNTLEKPTIVMAIDNSASIASVQDSASIQALKASLDNTAQQLEENGYQLEYRSFSGAERLDSVSFHNESSDLSRMLGDIATDYEGRNLASVVLLSDGIYNEGVSPSYRPYSYRLNTVGLGDTIPKQDINIRNLFYNKIAYQGNKFPLVAELANTGFEGETVNITVKNKGNVVASETLTFSNNRDVNTIEFLLEANSEGMQRYEVEVQSLEGEFTNQNNTSQAFVEIIEGKENILLLASSPHPDIKAIRLAIESNKNYELRTAILSVEDLNESLLSEIKYDLVIFHQLPAKNRDNAIVRKYMEEASARWFIVGSQTDLFTLSRNNNILNVASVNNDTDEVSAVYNNSFNGFQLDVESQAIIEEYLPLTVPFGRIELKNNPEVILYQKVGTVETSKPLLVSGEIEGKKTSVMLAEGLWQWRLQEYAKNDNTQAFDGFISKLTQFLSAKEDKRRFRVYPEKDEFVDTEAVVFQTEIYNEIYEEVYGYNISLSIKDETEEERKYSYQTNESNTQYRVSNLPEGVYQYTATAEINGEQMQSSGEFTVRSLQIENLNLTANHQLLRELSSNTGGKFFTQNNLGQLAAQLQTQEARGKIYTSQAFLPIINLKWLFFVLLILVSLEWGLRKYMGSY